MFTILFKTLYYSLSSKKSVLFVGGFIYLTVSNVIIFLTDYFTSYADVLKFKVMTVFLAVFVALFFTTVDFITGVIASLKEGNRILSIRVSDTIIKFSSVLFYSVIGLMFLVFMEGHELAVFLAIAPIGLSILKEFISIGENLEKIYGGKIYIYTIVEKFFLIVEVKFIGRLERFFKVKEEDENTK